MSDASMRDVAERAGVSIGTVSNVVNRPDKVSAKTVARVQQAIDELGFVRNDAARQLRNGTSNTIGLVVLDIRNPFYTDVARGAEDAAALAGLSLTLGNSDENGEREAAYLELFAQQRVHGVIVSPSADISPQLQRLRARRIPTVLLGRAVDDPSFSSVSVDDFAGGQLAVDHLVSVGCRHIAFLGGPLDLPQFAHRLAGARAAAARARVQLELVELHAATVLDGRAAGADIVARPASERPDGVFCANDLISMGVLQALVMQGSGLRVPEDVALIGYDDIEFAAAAVVPLSSIRQPRAEIGATAVSILLEEAATASAPQVVQFQPELVVRASTTR